MLEHIISRLRDGISHTDSQTPSPEPQVAERFNQTLWQRFYQDDQSSLSGTSMFLGLLVLAVIAVAQRF